MPNSPSASKRLRQNKVRQARNKAILDRAGAKGIIHKNAAGRQKSRLQRAIKAAKASA